MKYVLILFLAGGHSDTIIPQIIEQSFPTMLSCWNAGFAMKSRNPKKVLWYNCETLKPEHWDDEQ